jgi:hypothetical protein
VRKPGFSLIFFVGVFLLLLSFSPGSIREMGYTGQDLRACNQLLASAGETLTLRPVTPPTQWSRNGVLSLLPHVPFLLASRLFFGNDPIRENQVVAFEPVLATSLLLLVMFLWGRRLCSSELWSLGLTLAAGFSTLLWPYAYIGLETTQSLFLLCAAYLAIESGPPRRWPRTLLFAACCVMALTAKSTGAFLIPAVAFLICGYFRRPQSAASGEAGVSRGKLVVVVVAVAGLFFLNYWTRTFFWARFGGTRVFLSHWLVRDPIAYLSNLLSFFGSPNKGLVFYAPAALLSLWLLPRVMTQNRPLALFALLTLFGLAGGFSLLKDWSDETWGPRYLHSALAPLFLCLAAGLREPSVRRKLRWPLAGLAAAGLSISFLGVLFYYGSLHQVCLSASQSTLEALQGDPVWNHARFNARLMRILSRRLGRSETPAETWVPAHIWFLKPPPGSPPAPTVDLAPYARPQPLILRDADEHDRIPSAGLRRVFLGSLWLGLFLLLACFRRAATAGPPEDQGLQSAGRGAGAAAALFLFTSLLAWSSACLRDASGDYRGTPALEASPSLRAGVARVVARVAPTQSLFCVTERKDYWTYVRWQRLLYPRGVYWVRSPQEITSPANETLRRTQRIRFLLWLGDPAASPPLVRPETISKDSLLGELGR